MMRTVVAFLTVAAFSCCTGAIVRAENTGTSVGAAGTRSGARPGEVQAEVKKLEDRRKEIKAELDRGAAVKPERRKQLTQELETIEKRLKELAKPR